MLAHPLRPYRRGAALLAALALSAACVSDADTKTPDPADADTDTDTDADTDSDTDADSDTDTDSDTDADVVAPATEGTLDLSFRLDAEGSGVDRLDDVALLDAAGTVRLDGVDHFAVAYQDHDWTETGYHLYDLLSIAEDGSNLAVTYLYCQDGGIPYAYTESFAHPMDWETASGSCEGGTGGSSASVSLPALTTRPAGFDPGVRIDGEDVSYDGATGHVTMEGVDRALHPFNTVDCTDCPGGPWLEVHSLLDGPDDACFGILYLYPDDPTYVQVEYTMCLPSLTRPTASLAADWTGGTSAAMAPRPPGLYRPRPARIPPPR